MQRLNLLLTVRYVPFLILEYDASERKVSQRENEMLSRKKKWTREKEVPEKMSCENKRRLQFRWNQKIDQPMSSLTQNISLQKKNIS